MILKLFSSATLILNRCRPNFQLKAYFTMHFKYPSVKRDDTILDNLHGNQIADPYRWLEDPDAEDTKQFVDAQNNLTMPYLNECALKSKIHDRIEQLWNYPKYDCPFREGDRYFYFYNSGLQNQRVLYVQPSLDSDASIFFDPNELSEDGTVSLRSYEFSEDGNIFAYGLSESGSDRITIKFRIVETGKDFEDKLEDIKFSCITWTHDNKGIFYNKYDKVEGKCDGTETTTNLNQKLYYHRIGTKQSEDILCASWPDNPKWMTHVTVSDCGNYILASISEGCEPVNRLYSYDLRNSGGEITGIIPFKKIVDNFNAKYEYVTNEDNIFTFRTNLNSPMYKLINIDLDKPSSEENLSNLIDENKNNLLEWVACVNQDKLVVCYLENVKSMIYVYSLKSGTQISQLPLDIGSVVSFSGKKKHSQIFYQFVSFLTPSIIYSCDMSVQSYAPQIFRKTVLESLDTSQFEVNQLFYSSRDGTKIPMFIVHKKNIELDGSHPLYLYGYGGFSISITPSFSISRLVFMRNFGGVVAIPNIRGGDEYGEKWHKGGSLSNKQNCFDDFQAAAEYLIENKYTSAKNLIINGGSNGGLLVAACANQRPDLFGCVVSQVGVMDMLRFHKFTIGHAWTTDYGSSENKDEFQWLIKYSPLHNVPNAGDLQGNYPATLLLTADHDDRVVPLHSLKFIAQLQHKFASSSKQTNPLMIRVDTKAGHGAGTPTSKKIEEITDVYCFIARTLNIQWND